MRVATYLAIVLVSLAGTGSAARADEGERIESSVVETKYTKKERRLKITGWTMIGAGVAFPVIMAPLANNDDPFCEVGDCPYYAAATTSYFLGPTMVLIGMGLLIRGRKLKKRREAPHSLLIIPRANGIAVSGRF